MAFSRPTLQQLQDRILADVESRLPGTEPRLRQSLLGILARAHAGSTHGLYGFLDYLSRQIVPSLAESYYLELHASWWGVYRLAAATATGNITLSGVSGTLIPAGTTLQRSDGVQYTTNADATIAAGTATAAVTAVVGGMTTNALAGVKLTLVSPITGVQSSATVATGGLTGGTDAESDDAMRSRLQQLVQNKPQGGATADYTKWMMEVAGTTRCWVMPNWSGAGTVGLYFVRDNDATIIPDAALVAAMQAYIDDTTRKPVTAAVTVYAPTAVPVAMTISLSPNTAAVQAAVTAELQDLFSRTNVEDGTGSGKIYLSKINEAISLATGENNHAINLTVDVTFTAGQLGTLGTLTFQTL